MKNVVIAFNLGVATGRDEIVGALTYIRDKPDWNLRIINRTELPHLLRSPRGTDISGLITSCVLDPKLLALLANAHFPSVFLEVPRKLLPTWRSAVSLLKSDNRDVGRIGAEHFLALGRFASYAFVKSVLPYDWANERAQSFKFTLAKAGLRTRIFESRSGTIATDDPAALQRWLHALPKPAAVMAASDERAMDVIEACHTAGIRLPEQLSLLSVDNDIVFCEHVRPTLTSIQLNCREQGHIAAQELDRLMSRGSRNGRIRLVEVPPLKLIERESTRPTPPAVTLVERALSFIREKACSGIGVPDVAAHLGISRRLVDLRFRELTGGTVAAEILRIKMAEVERLIATGERSARKLAAKCGFGSVKYLLNLFRRTHGCTIRAWQPNHSSRVIFSKSAVQPARMSS